MAHENTADNPVKVIDAVSMVYAKSLMELAEDAGVIDDIADELSQLTTLVATQPELSALLNNKAISAAARTRSIEAIFSGRVSDLTYRFLQVLNDKGRLGVLPTVNAAFARLLKEKRGEVDVHVTSAQPLSAAQLDAVATKVGSAIDGKAIVTADVDESLIGGLKLRIGDQQIDGSVATQLQNIKRDIIARGRESIRSNAATLMEE